MYHLPLTLETPALNLALDEALLDAAVEGELPGETLRLWESRDYFVVLGRSSSPEREARQDACRRDGVPVLRRPSGGAAVVAGPGCLMYALVLDANRRPELRSVDRAHQVVLGRIAEALRPLVHGVRRAGTSDLALADGNEKPPQIRKFSGNSLRLKRDRVLYHGTILYDFPLEQIGRWLGSPTRMPEYRQGREHGDFLANFPASREAIARALGVAWQIESLLTTWPCERTERLSAQRYGRGAW